MVLQFEGLRGVAAVAVFFYHFHHVPALAPLTERLPGFFGTGWVFVDLFFILSGWVVGHVYHNRLATRPDAAYEFFVARAARLYPLLLTSLLAWYVVMPLLGVAVDWTGLGDCLPQLLTLSFTWGPLACTVPVAPAWSISAEAAVYLAFPLLLWSGVTRTAARAATLIALGVLGYASLAAFGPGIHTIDGMAPIRAAFGFAMGLGLWRLGDMGNLPQGRFAAGMQIGSFFGIAALVALGGAPFGIILLFALLVWAMVCGSGPVVKLCRTHLLVMLGRLSFGIYLWHWFAIVLMQQASPALGPTTIAATSVALVVVWAHVSYTLIEAPGRRAIRFALGRRPGLSAKTTRVPHENSL
ncbi:acyltransferase family protein [Candidatus Rhodobacter oscarellae]|nr:acyltransferase [Candidatus Rhodobacter lobularis]